ncbi:UvrD-helicase domain-containing protein [Thiohalorhabdus methylotrophus]|uniref:ATP-dependent DNA helicase Rep n=1 Tax=Thiohalorhabdus methylotrophus TaxID=3242694 RepID=A0ABV4TW72_9GAMM
MSGHAEGLNPQQRSAVLTSEGPLLVLAGAGSGKTRVITAKIAHLIESEGLPARSIIAVTFTNKAAREMEGRVRERLEDRSARGLTVSTFHRLGMKILQREITRLGYREPFSIFDTEDQIGLVRGLMQETGNFGATQPDEVRARISDWKNDLVGPAAALEQAANDHDLRAARVYARYQESLHAHNAVDFDDLIGLPVRLFEEHPDVGDRWRERCRHLLVDEFQDINGAQYALMRKLVGDAGSVTVVGDDDQSIYAWRGASPELLHHLQADYPALQVVKLEQNYRCSGRILNAANRLIANNPHLFEKRLWSDRGGGEAIQVLEAKDAEHEAERVISALLRHRFQNATRYGDYAMLYRSNHQSRELERALRDQGIPYQLYGGMSFFDRAEVRDVVAYFRLLANPDDDIAFLRAVNTPRRGVGAESLERLAGLATEAGISLCAAAGDTELRDQLPKRAATGLAEFAGLIETYGARCDNEDPGRAACDLVEEIGYKDFIAERAESDKGAERRAGNVDNLLNWLTRFHEENEGAEDDPMGAFVRRLTLLSALDRQEEAEEADGVHLMTLHTAKGLEFPYVFLVGMEEEILPHRNSLEADTVEEERRLAYVGLTRAQYGLTLSWARSRRRYGETLECEPSRFLDELPEEELSWDRLEAEDPEQSQALGAASLDQMRNLLN